MKKIIIFSTRIRESTVAYQLHLKLIESGMMSQIVCMESEVERDDIKSLRVLKPYIYFLFRIYGRLEYLLEKYLLSPNMKIKHSLDLSVVPQVVINSFINKGDILHIHWCKSGFLSSRQISRLSKKNTLFWTHHDSWLISGLPHHSADVVGIKEKRVIKMINHFSFNLRKNVIINSNIIHIQPSTWQLNEFKVKFNNKIIQRNIHNCFSSEYFYFENKKSSRYYTLGFGAINSDSNPLKGGKELWLALSKVKKSVDMSKVKVIVFGVEDISHVKNKLINIGGFREDNITIYGYIKSKSQMASIYSNIDCFIQPSKIENLSTVMLEAMFSACQVVHFDVSGMQDLKAFNPSIVSVPPYSLNKLVDSIVNCIQTKSYGTVLNNNQLEKYSDRASLLKHKEIYFKEASDLCTD